MADRTKHLAARVSVLLVAVAWLAGCGGCRKSAAVHDRRRERLLFQMGKIKAGEGKGLAGIDPRFIGDVLEDSKCVEKLEQLAFSACDVSDTRLGRLSSLPNVRSIIFDETRGTDEFLKNISGMDSVEFMGFRATDLTADGIRSLAGFPSLKSLRLGQRDVEEAGVSELMGLAALEELDLSQTP